MNAKGALNLVFISQTKMLKQPFTFFHIESHRKNQGV